MRNILILFPLLFLSNSIWGQSDSYRIEVQLDHYDQQEILLTYQFLDRYPVVDTAQINTNGRFVFEGDSLLIPGVYMLVLPPENEFITVLINEEDQQFTIKSDFQNLTSSMEVTGSTENQLYYEYLNYLNDRIAVLNGYRQAANEATSIEEESKYQQLFNQDVQQIGRYQETVIAEYPNSLTASLIKAELETPLPNFKTNSQDELNYLQYAFRKKHYFDHLDFNDGRLLRSEILFQKVDFYLNRLTHARPDSIIAAVDYVLEKLKANPKNYKYYLDHLMLTYANSDVVEMEAVYVHIVENYYAKGEAPWVDKDNLAEMIADAESRKPLLLGQPAPEITMQLRDGSSIALYDVNADFTVIYLWQPNCSHCKKSMPYMKDFYKNYKDKGVEIFAGCTKTVKKVPDCWKYVDENDIGHWINTVDPYMRSRFVQLYMAEKTPKIYILDADKKIVMKDIGAEQLPELLDYLISEKQQSEAGKGGKS